MSMSTTPDRDAGLARADRYLVRARLATGQLAQRRWAPFVVDAAILLVAALDVLPWAGTPSSTTDVVVSVLSVSGFVFRRRWPVLTWLMVLPALVCALVLVSPLLAIYSVAARCRRWWWTAGVVTLTFVATMVAAYLQGITDSGGVAIWQTVVAAALSSVAPAALALAFSARHSLQARLRQLQDFQQRERGLLTDAVIADERTRLAREMHDVVSHQVSLIALQAGALRVTTTDPAARRAAATIRGLAGQTLDELRTMVGVLRGGHENDLAPQPRLRDIPQLVADSGLDATLIDCLPAPQTWSEQVQRAAYRSVQEGLTNVRKHAAGATVTVELEARGRILQVAVRDTGPVDPGSGPTVRAADSAAWPHGGHGLLGLKERAELFDGSLVASTNQAGGFDLVVELLDAGA